MKISKLFHWLYAILMLLPFAFFVPSVLYYAFNDNATMQSVEVPKMETISVDFNQYVINGDFSDDGNWSVNRYTYSIEDGYLNINLGVSPSIAPFVITGNNVHGVDGHKFLFKMDYLFSYTDNLGPQGCEYVAPNYFFGSLVRDSQWHTTYRIFNSVDRYGRLQIQPYLGANVDLTGEVFRCTNIQLFDLTKMFGVGDEPTVEQFNTYFPNSYYSYTDSELMQITYDTGETEQLVENTSIINYAWESIWDLPLFSWTKITFVSVPFSYLTGIFGLGASNSLNYVFGYFVTISICWLVFDVIMYVPMLVHRWIDKARIE